MNDFNPNEKSLEIDNLPNRITLFRILLIPIILISLLLNLVKTPLILPYHHLLGYIACWAFVVAALTDIVDGHIARTRGIVTTFGSFLDPIADKFLVVSALIALQALNRIQVVLVIILVLREMYMTSLRLLALERELSVPVNRLGKWKTATQMTAIPFLMAWDDLWGIPTPMVGTVLIYLAAIFSVYSAGQYSFALLKKFEARLKLKHAKEDLPASEEK
ncbi:MAG: CDP-diacylglycerol--glycerol-3-phosphate 3-phosphatidyltransferase [Pseudomonadota bacterium]